MPTIAYPSSQLVSRSIPFTVLISLDPDVSGQALRLSVRLEREVAGQAGQELSATAEMPSAEGTIEAALCVADLAEGAYAGKLTLRAGEAQAEWPVRFYRLPDGIAEPFPFGVYAVPLPEDDPALCRQRLREARQAGINLICQHMDKLGERVPLHALDEAGRLGIRSMPSTNLRLKPEDVSEECLDRLSIPEPEDAARGVCRGNQEVRERAAKDLAERLQSYAQHPAFSGLVYYGDDLFLRVKYADGKAALSCYCDHCREDFRQRTGLEPPVTTERTAGLVPPDHPWLQWMRYRCGETFGGLIRRLEEVRREVAPTVEMGLCHGFPYSPFSQIGTGIYGPLTQPTAVVSSYGYPYLRSPRVDLIAHYELGRMGQRDQDVWMLGAINSNWTNYPAWQVYQNYWNMLAAGYKFIGFFSWHDFVAGAEAGYAEEAEACQQALADCGAHKDWILPVAAHWQPSESPFAALYSFATEAFDLAPENRGHAHLENVLAFYRQALRRHVPMEIVCEEEILDGTFERYEAICLHDVRALPTDVQKQLVDYAAHGGTVFVDNDILMYYDESHPTVSVRGAIECSPETMIAILRDRRPPGVTCTNEHVTVRRLHAGNLEYLVLVNNYADQYWGFRFHYWNKRIHENYEHMRFVKDAPVDAEIRFAEGGRWVADLHTGAVLGSTDEPLHIQLESSWGRALALLPCQEVRLDVRGPDATSQGSRVVYELEAVSEGGRRSEGAFAVKVTIMSPSGRVSGSSGYLGLTSGAAQVEIPIAANEETGEWTVTCEGGFPRRTIAKRLAVSRGTKPAIGLMASSSFVRGCQ